MKIYDYNGKKNICGDRVHEARCRHRMTQSDLAAKLQLAGIIIERDSISRIEIGTRFVADYELRELASILNVSVPWLLGIVLCPPAGHDTTSEPSAGNGRPGAPVTVPMSGSFRCNQGGTVEYFVSHP